MTKNEVEVKPFEEIAVALSGGGFRAACFGLGCLSYLHRIQFKGDSLLSKVKFISSASGGSITNLYYSSQIEKGKSFEEVFSDLFELLDNELLVKRAFEILNENAKWKERPSKGRNLINAFAMAYDELIFHGETFAGMRNNLPGKVDEICINATEFTNGITFRFQAGGTGLVGNKYLHFKDEQIADKLKLGDILAASSCFPMGFEPIMFPNDFIHKALSVEELIQSFQEKSSDEYIEEPDGTDDLIKSEIDTVPFQPIGLMDGGITDNQGIYSFLLAEGRKRRSNGRGYDLFIACDVASSYMDAYEIPAEVKSFIGSWRAQGIINLFKFSPLIFLGGLSALIFWKQPGWLYVLTTLTAVLFSIYLISATLLLKGKSSILTKNRTWGLTLFKYLNSILITRVSALRQMLSARLKSVGIMTGDVYLKQIRRLTFMSLYQNDESGKKWRQHGLANFIYELTPINRINRKNNDWKNLHYADGTTASGDPSNNIERIAEKAQKMDTTLWFDKYHVKDEVKEALIATGQFTTCYNLIKYCNKLLQKSYDQDLEALLKSLLHDWQAFQEDPSRFDSPSKFQKT